MIVEAIAGFGQFGLAHDDWVTGSHLGTRSHCGTLCSGNKHWTETRTWPRRHVSPLYSTWPMAVEFFSISPAQAAVQPRIGRVLQRELRPDHRAGDGLLPDTYHGNSISCASLCQTWSTGECSSPTKSLSLPGRVEKGTGIPRVVGSIIPSGQPGYRPGRGAPRSSTCTASWSSIPSFVPESARGTVATSGSSTTAAGSGGFVPGLAEGLDARRRGLGKADTRQLVDLLGHRNAWWRTTAQRLLVERQDHAASASLDQYAQQQESNPLAAPRTLDIGGSQRTGRSGLESCHRRPCSPCASTHYAWRA